MMHIGLRAKRLGIALEQMIAQLVYAGRHIHRIALRLHAGEHIMQAFEDREESSCADIASIGREVEQNNAHAALGQFTAAQGNQFVHTSGQHGRTLVGRAHILTLIIIGLRTTTENHRACRTIKLGDRDHYGCFHRHETTI